MKVFIEEQRFSQSWMVLLIVISSIMPIVLVAKQLIDSKGQDDEAIRAMIIVSVSLVLVFVLFFSLKLKTRIDEVGIYYRFVPFHFSDRLIRWDEIQEAYVRKYDAISEYGGWGFKGGRLWKKSKGKAFNVSGDKGIQLVLKNKKKVLIGTKKENEAKMVLQKYSNKFVITT